MNGPGFDWLNLPPGSAGNGINPTPPRPTHSETLINHNNTNNTNNTNNHNNINGSGSASPAPNVSFGISGSPHITTTDYSKTYASSLQPNLHSHSQDSNNSGSPNSSDIQNYYFKNNSADQLTRKSFGGYSNSNSNDRLNPNNINYNSTFLNITRSDNNSLESIAHSNSLGGDNSTSLLDYDEDSGIPLSLTAQELTLQESKTYMRWYSDILARTNSRTVTLNDVFNFLINFKLSQIIKDKISRIFQKIIYSINIGEFFALLRLISHTLTGAEPRRKLIKVQAAVPTPPSILSKKRQNDDDNDSEGNLNDNDLSIANGINNNGNDNNNIGISSIEQNKPLDLDSFTQFILTGERPDDTPKKKRNKKLKSVKFSDRIVTDIHEDSFMPSPSGSPFPQQESLDYSLPMDQLLDRMKSQPQQSNQFIKPPSPDEDEQQLLRDMEGQINHFKNLNSVDTALIGGSSASIHFHDGYSNDNLLQPNMTGPAQMSRMFSPSPEPKLLKPNMTGPTQMAQFHYSRDEDDEDTGDSGNSINNNESPSFLRPNVTGPADMARIFSPESTNNTSEVPKISLQSFTNQMTGNTMANTLQNSRTTNDGSPLRPSSSSFSTGSRTNGPQPPPVPNTRRTRSISSPTPRISSPLSNIVIAGDYTNSNLNVNPSPVPLNVPPPVPIRSPLHSSPNPSTTNVPSLKIPPPPPPARRRNTSFSQNQNQTQTQNSVPPLPPKISIENDNSSSTNLSTLYNNGGSNDSTIDILDDLKALQEEVDKIRDMTGGF
ncbi:uncharacterized protein RJT21DRAFT_120826 [Scheffersomyces amazonensis]|uniref:uncharacterized protein n=1 Tax=Scheffersomyces amazonensis TaxID=1078765 RepID=UPI00315CE94A